MGAMIHHISPLIKLYNYDYAIDMLFWLQENTTKCYIDTIYGKTYANNQTIDIFLWMKTSFCHGGRLRFYVIFENEFDLTYFLLRWS